MEKTLPVIPAKRYFSIGEVSELCAVKTYVLRYWEQEFAQLRPMKRRGNRRYYQHHEVLLVRRIRELLYDQGFTINGARGRLAEAARGHGESEASDPPEANAPAGEPTAPAEAAVRTSWPPPPLHAPDLAAIPLRVVLSKVLPAEPFESAVPADVPRAPLCAAQLRHELLLIRELLAV